MWPPLLVFGPSFWSLTPLLLNPGDGPGKHSTFKRPQTASVMCRYPAFNGHPTSTVMCSIGIGGSKYLGVQWIFARISPNLPEKLLCDFCRQIFSHKDHEELVSVLPPKKVFICVSTNVGTIFGRQATLGAIFCPDFQGVFPDFQQIKTLGVRLHHLHTHYCRREAGGILNKRKLF